MDELASERPDEAPGQNAASDEGRTPPSSRTPTIGLAIATIGRPEIGDLLESAGASNTRPLVVAIGNQSGGPLPIDLDAFPFEVVEVASSGGASQGRNDAVQAIADRVDVLGFPNDDSTLPPDSLGEIARAFAENPHEALAGALVEFGITRFALPPQGTLLDPVSTWRAIEQTSYVRTEVFRRLGGFRADLGTGSAGAWQSGEITDLLLRILEDGGSIVSRPDIAVLGRGEQRQLSVDAIVAKHRRYARGTGYVYRVHPYPATARLKTVLGPWRRPLEHHPDPRVSLRIATARSTGRIEGLLGRVFPSPRRAPGPRS